MLNRLMWIMPLVALSLHTAHGQGGAQSPPAPERVAASPSPPKQLTRNDYVQPIEAWLKAQGSPLSGADFYTVGKAYGIDPDFLIAVTKAETQLGKVRQRGSSCNVGSVGSYDATNGTFGCRDTKHGIELIAQTLNNQLLGKYDRVSQLSRAYNKTGAIYASSEYNWHRNCVTTMNALKGRNEQDYVYRIDTSKLP